VSAHDVVHLLHGQRVLCGNTSGCVALRVELVTCPRCLAAGGEVPESALLKEVRALAAAHGWLCYHTHDSRHSEAGFPDVVLARPGHQVILAELKDARGKLTLEQQRWHTTVRQCTGVHVALWRPSMLEEIRALLRGNTAR